MKRPIPIRIGLFVFSWFMSFGDPKLCAIVSVSSLDSNQSVYEKHHHSESDGVFLVRVTGFVANVESVIAK